MLRLGTASAALAVMAGLLAAAAGPGAYPPPKSLGPVETYGKNIQRAMTLMATSTPLKRNTVRVLFYGQSITADTWTRTVEETLRRRYPLTDFVIDNRALGGYYAKSLVRTAEADLYPFYPDLLIFHVYGDEGPYEDVIRRVRERTTADILMASDHVAPRVGERLDEETDPSKLRPPKTGEPEAAWRGSVFLPRVAKKYGAELADVRTLWKQYLRDTGLAPADLLRDGLHLNDRGNVLMSEIMLAHLRHHPELPDAAWKDRVTTYTVGPEGDVSWKDGKLVLPFEGNKVDLVCADRAGPPAAVRIDGQKPSAFPELYIPTRAELVWPRGPYPVLLRLGAARPRVLEDWTLTMTGISPDRKQFKFRVVGTVTGDDGEGEAGKPFVSKSGRVVIDPEDLWLDYPLIGSQHPHATALEARWRVVPMFADEFAAPATRNPFGDTVVTAAQGLPNGKHTLELTGTPDTPLAAVRVYRPPLPAAGP